MIARALFMQYSNCCIVNHSSTQPTSSSRLNTPCNALLATILIWQDMTSYFSSATLATFSLAGVMCDSHFGIFARLAGILTLQDQDSTLKL